MPTFSVGTRFVSDLNNEMKGIEMFTIKWNGDYAQHEVIFETGWARLNCCNAATYKHSNWSYERNGQEVKTEKFYLVSYATPIMLVERKYYMSSGEIISTKIYVNESMWNCSRTTIQHISRFCNNLNFFYGIYCTYGDIRDAMKSADLHYGFSVAISAKTRVFRRTDKELRKTFKNECPKFY